MCDPPCRPPLGERATASFQQGDDGTPQSGPDTTDCQLPMVSFYERGNSLPVRTSVPPSSGDGFAIG
jgi:hypothetical protein